jgi:SNF2 family DNA or RNA helicase
MIRLSPAGTLRWEASEDEPAVDRWRFLRERLETDWREGLFRLAADRPDVSLIPVLRYWQSIAERLLTRLCQLPEGMAPEAISPLTEAERIQCVLSAPPMPGGEYLTGEMLGRIWETLLGWCEETAAAANGLPAFLLQQAPRWHQVGRVCFHLAENKSDTTRPFAFMATYISGLGASGQTRHQTLGKALEQYAGAGNRPALIKLLAPVQTAAERCDWVKEMADNGTIYRPLAWTAEQAYRFLLSVPVLEESGLMTRLPDWWQNRIHPQVSVTIGDRKPAIMGLDSLLDFDFSVTLGEEPLSAEEIKTLMAGGEGLVLFKGRWIEVDRSRLQEAITHWETLRQKTGYDKGISFIEGMRLLAGTSPDLKAEKQLDDQRNWVHVNAGAGLSEILTGLRDPSKLDGSRIDELQTELRPYQQDGVSWLLFLTGLGLGACLADDMGLGKTVQALALMLKSRKSRFGPSLLVAPASLLGNWQAEARRFAPSLNLVFLHPAETDGPTLQRIKDAPARELAAVDLAVTTYAMLVRQEWLAEVNWHLIIIDEAQAIKNPGTRQARALKKLTAKARLAMTGTPVENRLGDLWSIFDFLNPGLLGSAAVFKSFVKRLESRSHDHYAPLRRLVGPYILRRLKTDRTIIADLPDKVETSCYCYLTRSQIRLYEQVVAPLRNSLRDSDGIKRRALVLQTLMRLKQICNHPSQLTNDGVYAPADSGKFLRIAEICEELAERQERVLVFTQFREIVDMLETHLSQVFRRAGLVLHGGTPIAKRKAIVDRFQAEEGPPFMILSLKAGGTGLNLTAASHVIHFDRWWNPAVEDQATDRAFRIGQKKSVLVHKFVTRGSVEEKIDRMITEKRQLAAELLSDAGEVDLTALDDNELLELVSLDIQRATI